MAIRTFSWAQAAKFNLAVLCGLVAGCARENPFFIEVNECPGVAIVENTGALTVFSGLGRDQDDISYRATLSQLSRSCKEDEELGVENEVTFSIVARKGPAAISDFITIPYFVVVSRGAEDIIAKRVNEVEIDFAGRQVAGVRETLRQNFPDLEALKANEYEVLVGFQLDNDQAIYNLLQ
ncbi:MAG: hypothetical protein AAGF15_09190 [Pseudomonadota bacterium]